MPEQPVYTGVVMPHAGILPDGISSETSEVSNDIYGNHLGATDVSARADYEPEFQRLTRMYSALRQVNRAIMRLPGRDDLFDTVCRILGEHDVADIAWIGWHDENTCELLPVASWGDTSGYLKHIRRYSDDRPGGRGPAGTAFREGRTFVCTDMSIDPATLSWRDDILFEGFRSCASFPIREQGIVVGVLNVYAHKRAFFQDEEIALLANAAEDISFALDNLAREAEREGSEVAARASLQESKELREAINAHALVTITDAQGRITFVNDRLCEVSGYSRGELLGEDHGIVNSGYHSASFFSDLWNTIRSGSAWHGEIRNKAKDGRFYWVDVTIVPFLNADGTPRQFMAIRTVITERKEAELALRAEGDRAQRYLDTAEVILLALDVQGRITMVNRYACSIFGYNAEELIGRDFLETCIPPRILDETREKLADVHAGPDSSLVVNAIITRSGEERIIEWRNTLLRDEHGHVVSSLSSGTDRTDRIERDEAVDARRIAEERMRFALQVANVGIWDMDYTTGVLTWSETLEAHYGLAPGTFDGTFEAFLNGTHPDDRAGMLEIIAKAATKGEDFSILTRSVAPDGTERWLSGAGRILLGTNGEPVRGVGVSIDVTERHKLEAQFQQAQKMEAIGRLAGGIAHDFNNLLTAILGYCELLLDDLPPQDERAQDIREIQKAGKSAAALTRQLLAFSRKEIIQPTVLDLNEVVTNLRGMLGRLIGEDVAIHLALNPLPSIVKADRSQVEQVIMNLAVNARDAMANGGTLTIETAVVELDADYARLHPGLQPGLYLTLTVSDTGTGMTAEVQSRLFEPFFTTKEVGKGSGLGLATVHGIMSRSGGSVTVYSEIGVGSSFNVYFPTIDGTVQPEEKPASQPKQQVGRHTVLVVDDAEGIREYTKRRLERCGYTVLVAAHPEEAIRIFDANASIDVLLTDVVMPSISGPELSRQLLVRRPTLTVVYMSGYTDEAIVHHGVLNPGIALLSKPFTSEALEQKIGEALARE